MSSLLQTRIGSLDLKNPVIAAPGEHLIEEAGVRAAILSGAGAVVVKSTNESEGAREQLRRAEYVALSDDWEPIAWDASAPRSVTLLTRSGLHPLQFEAWLERNVHLDRLARENDCLLVPSLILADLDEAVRMAKLVAEAGLRVLEFNVGTPYASQTAKGAVSTELLPERIEGITRRMSSSVDIPIWIKVTGQSERVPDLADAAFGAGARGVVMAGRLLGLVPDLETHAPLLSTSCGVGGFWNLPLTCHWLAATRRMLGPGHDLVGINGAIGGRDVARMMLAGASAVGLSSAVMMRGFGLLTESINELSAYCASKDMKAAELIGRAADARKTYVELPSIGDRWRNYVPRSAAGLNSPKG